MNRYVIVFLCCMAAVGCSTTSQDAEIFTRARAHAQASPKCKAVLDKHPDILSNPQMLPSQAPDLFVAFDHDEQLDDKTWLNTRILVEMASTNLDVKAISVEDTTY